MTRRKRKHALTFASREPVRLYLGGVLATVVALLVGYGVLDGETGSLWLAVATAVLAVPAVEGTRQRVTPVAAARLDTAVARAEGYVQGTRHAESDEPPQL